jgi:hypothetical protein
MAGPAEDQDQAVAGLGGDEHPTKVVEVGLLRGEIKEGGAGQLTQCRWAVVAPRFKTVHRRREEELWRRACPLLLLALAVVGSPEVKVSEGGRRESGGVRA